MPDLRALLVAVGVGSGVQGLDDDCQQPCIVAWHGIPDVEKRNTRMRNWLAHHA